MSSIKKFRAWDKEEKEYYYNAEHTYDFFCSGRGCYAESFGEVLNQPDRFVVEQFTGLLDRNGKEIYEGDIVKTKSPDQPNFKAGVIEFTQRAFWISNVPSDRPDHTNSELLLKYWEMEIEVIGNIHENPELLGDKE